MKGHLNGEKWADQFVKNQENSFETVKLDIAPQVLTFDNFRYF
jgi:hypothetical protein